MNNVEFISTLDYGAMNPAPKENSANFYNTIIILIVGTALAAAAVAVILARRKSIAEIRH